MRKQKLLQKCISILLVSILAGIYTFNLSAKAMGDDIDLDGEDWKEGLRSTIEVVPVTASINGTLLTIECTTGRSDITVCITGDDGFSYEEIVLSENTCFISIDLSDVPNGVYRLDLTNQWGDHIYGDFEIR